MRIRLTLKEAIKKFKLDRRRKWFAYCGNIVYDYKYSHACSGCTETRENTVSPERGSGCHECGYTGRRRDSCPVPAMDEHNNPIEITDKDFTYA